MDIEKQKITVRINNFNENHFINLGYNVPRNTYVEIFVNELPSGSGLKIDVECNYCGKIFKKSYRRYLETKDNLCCNDCKDQKMMQTSLAKYGNICSLRNEEIQNKSKDKNLENLGVQFPFQNKEILKKCFNSCIEKYGKRIMSRTISKQQIYLHELFGGEINHIEFPYRLDIFFMEENIYLEYDGSGHTMGIKFKNMSLEEFYLKELGRSLFLEELGYKEFRIISNDDVLPSDAELLKIKERAFDLLLNKNFQQYIYNLNTKTESFEE
jgi:hypothetical protein